MKLCRFNDNRLGLVDGDSVLDVAGSLDPGVLRTLDAIHLATAMALGDDLDAIVTYDGRMVASARLLGLPLASP